LVAGQELPEGYECVLHGAHSSVFIDLRAKKKLMKRPVTEDQRAQLDNLVTRYANGGPTALPSNKFNGSEGWFPSDRAPNKIRLEAFKPWKLRAYGFCREFNGRPTFFITGIDPSKKQDHARPEILQSAGAEAVRINNILNK